MTLAGNRLFLGLVGLAAAACALFLLLRRGEQGEEHAVVSPTPPGVKEESGPGREDPMPEEVLPVEEAGLQVERKPAPPVGLSEAPGGAEDASVARSQEGESLILQGVVVDAGTLAPLPNAQVRLAKSMGEAVLRTNSEGKFELPFADSGYLTVESPGYALKRWSFYECGHLRNDEGFVVLELPKGGSLRGVVSFEEGGAVQEGWIIAYDTNSFNHLSNPNKPEPWSLEEYRGRTDWQLWAHPMAEIGLSGEYHFESLGSGRYHLMVYSSVVPRVFQDPVDVVAGLASEKNITVSAGFAVRGVATLPDGVEINKAGVLFCWHGRGKHRRTPNVDRWVALEEDGSFSSGPLPEAPSCYVRFEFGTARQSDVEPTYYMEVKALEIPWESDSVWEVDLRDVQASTAPLGW